MYRISKDKGNNQNITLTNVETKASPIKRPVRSKTTSRTSSTATSEQTQPSQKKKTKSGREVVDVFNLIFGTE